MELWMIVVLVVVVLLVIWLISSYNKFIRMNNKVEEAFSTMDVYLKKRYDLIPNLVETIKGYTKHEAETLEKVIGARNMAVQAHGMDEKITSEKNFQTMMGPIYAIAEQYPDLKADTHFTQMMQELKAIETDIANARKFYNAVVMKFNNMVEMFPSNVLANIFHFARKPMYEIDEATQRENVKVSF